MASRNSSSSVSGPSLEPRLRRRRRRRCMRSSAGSVSGMVAALVRAAALLAREAGRGDHARERERVVEQLAQPLGVALQAGEAPERRARLVGRRRGAVASAARRPAGRLGLVRAPRAPRGGRTRSTRPASSTPAGSRRAGRCTRTRRPRSRPGSVERAVEVGRDAAHRVVRGGRHRHAARGAGRCPTSLERVRRRWGSGARSTARMSRPTALGRCARARPRPRARPRRAARARRRSARRRASSSVRALAADRLGDQEAVARPSWRSAVGWNWMNSRSASAAPAACGERQPGADRAARVGGALPQRGRAAGGEDPSRAPATGSGSPPRGRAHQPDAAAVERHSDVGGARLEHLDALVGGGERRQLARDAPAGGAAAGVHDAPARVAALEAERERAVAVGVEAARRARSRSRTRAGDSSHSTRTALARAAARPAASVSCDVQLGRVVVGERGGDPALRPVARRLGERRAATRAPRARPRAAAGARRRARRRRRRPRRRRPAAAAATALTRRYGTGIACPLYFRHPPRSSTTPGRTPSGPPHPGDRGASSSGATGSAASGARRPRRPSEQLLRGPPARVRRRGARDERARRRVRPGHADLSPAPGRRRCTRRAAPARWSTRCSAAASASASRRCGRPATTPSAARAMGFCLFNNVAIAARHALDSLGAERVLVLDWDVHHGNGTNAIFHELARGAVREHPPVAALSRHRRRCATSARARARATRSTCRCRPARARTTFCALVEHVVAAGGARSSSRTWSWSRRASTPTATTRSAAARSRPSSFARAGAPCVRSDELGAPVGARARGRLRPRRAGRLGRGDDGGARRRRRAALAPARRAGRARRGVVGRVLGALAGRLTSCG